MSLESTNNGLTLHHKITYVYFRFFPTISQFTQLIPPTTLIFKLILTCFFTKIEEYYEPGNCVNRLRLVFTGCHRFGIKHSVSVRPNLDVDRGQRVVCKLRTDDLVRVGPRRCRLVALRSYPLEHGVWIAVVLQDSSSKPIWI